MIDLDPAIVDQESIRKQRRKKLFKIYLIPILLFAITGAFFLRPGVFNIIFPILYSNPDANGAVSISQLQKGVNLIEPYIAYYNAGTAYIKANRGKEAEEELTESIHNNPPVDKICQVRVNLSYSIELQADDAIKERQNDQALVLLNRAEGVLYEDNCASRMPTPKPQKNPGQPDDKKQNKEYDENAERAKERISQKRNNIVSEINGTNNDSDSGQHSSEDDIEINEDTAQRLRDELMNSAEIQEETQRYLHQFKGIGDIHW